MPADPEKGFDVLGRTDHDEVAVLRLDRGPVNALDVDLLDLVTAELDRLADSSAAAVVLTGNGRAFSAGVDLPRLLEGGPDYAVEVVRALDRTYRTLFAFPRPVVGAAEGAAIAGGCVLLCGCDRRLVAESGGPLGVTELRVGVPFQSVSLEIMRNAVGGATTAELFLSGGLHGPEAAVQLGLAHEVVPGEALVDRAVAEARRLAAIPPATFALTKRQLRRQATERIAANAPVDDPQVEGLWRSPEAFVSIRAFVEEVLPRGR